MKRLLATLAMALVLPHTLAQTPPQPPEIAAKAYVLLDLSADQALAGMPADLRARSWLGFDADFSRALGARGWIGLQLIPLPPSWAAFPPRAAVRPSRGRSASRTH